MTTAEIGILRALAYADVFDFGLTKSELVLRLIGKKQINSMTIRKALDLLLEKKRVETLGNYVFFPGRNEVVSRRKSRLKTTTEKYLRAKRTAERLAKIPWIQGIFLTGTVAADNASLDDDIDLMIVARANYLWTTRLAVTILLELLGVRRKPGQAEVKDIFCVNLYLDESTMTVPQELQNLYTAHEVVLVKCLYERDEIGARFVHDNRWIREYLPNTIIPSIKHKKQGRKTDNLVERWLFWLQRAYMSRRITRERVTKQSAYFHPKDMAQWVLSRYDQALKNYEVER